MIALNVTIQNTLCNINIENTLAEDMLDYCPKEVFAAYRELIEKELNNYDYFEGMTSDEIKEYVEHNYELRYMEFASVAPWTFGEHITLDLEQLEGVELEKEARLFDCETKKYVNTQRGSVHIVLFSHDS